MGDQSDDSEFRKRVKRAVAIWLAGGVAIVGLFVYYGNYVYQRAGEEALFRFLKFSIPFVLMGSMFFIGVEWLVTRRRNRK